MGKIFFSNAFFTGHFDDLAKEQNNDRVLVWPGYPLLLAQSAEKVKLIGKDGSGFHQRLFNGPSYHPRRRKS